LISPEERLLACLTVEHTSRDRWIGIHNDQNRIRNFATGLTDTGIVVLATVASFVHLAFLVLLLRRS
jgi:hypothetical protein